MTIGERMFDELDKRGLTAYGLCQALGLGTSTTSNWKLRNTDPPAKYIVPICEYLGCSLEYLLTGQETEKAPAPGMSENGREMLELYEQLPEREQLLLLGRLQEMTSPVSSEVKGGSEAAGSSAGRAG
jgi:transcriptional regulator with XRE-family HTH domain